MKNILFIVMASVLLLSCDNTPAKSDEKGMDGTAPAIIDDGHNAQNALDYEGTYQGVLPCADCKGIEKEITLKYDGTFVETTKYLGKGEEKTVEEKGEFFWKADGRTIILKTKEPWPYFVGEHTLTRLDADGNKITGDAAERYVLKKTNK